jgi:hypothetical protein
MNLEQITITPEDSLAVGVLRQAMHDLRRFRSATGGMERELYRDARRWITTDDDSWPYSFVNICKLLDVPAEVLRAELLANVSLSWVGYWSKAGARFGRCCRASLTRAFNNSRSRRATAPLAPIYSLDHS